MIVVVTGGRDLYPTTLTATAFGGLAGALKALKQTQEGLVLRHGACRGADESAAQIARILGVETDAYPADWDTHGKAAGPIRNREMLQGADLLLALPGGRGTENCKKTARELGVPVVEL